MKKSILKTLTGVLTIILATTTVSMSAFAYTQDEWVEILRNNGSGTPTTGGAHPERYRGNQSNNSNTTAATSIPVCEHTYESTITSESTCTEQGVETFSCTKCGKSHTEKLELKDHEYSAKATTEPTCLEAGEMTYTCNVCGDSYTEPIEDLGHNEGEWETTVEPTCAEAGLKETRCTHCKEVMSTESIEAVGHTEGEWTVKAKATMFQQGEEELTCIICQEVLNSRMLPIAMTGWYVIGSIVLVALALLLILLIRSKRKTK